MKKLFLAVIAGLTVFASCKDEEETISRIEIAEGSTIQINVGEEKQLHVNHFPEHLQAPKYSWTSSSSNIVTVGSSGTINAISEGEATITVSTENNISAQCSIIVSTIEITGIELDKTDYEILIGESLQLKPVVSPSNATYANKMVYSSTDESVAKVDKDGNVEAMNVGECQIEVASPDGKIATFCNVKVLSITLNKTEIETIIGETVQLQPIAIAEIYKDKLFYESTNEAVAKVSSDGWVEAISVGECQIKVASQDGKITAGCRVVVNPIVITEIKFDKADYEIVMGESIQLKPIVSPSNATYANNLVYSSSDKSVAKISSDGIVETIGVGECIITATSPDDGKAKVDCKVKVLPCEVTSITLNQTELTLMQSESFKFTYSIEPQNATDKTVTWTTSDDNIAVIEADGTLTALNIGECTITAHSSNAEVSVQCKITVIQAEVKEVRLNKSSLRMLMGTTDNLNATVLPSAANQNVTWTSSNTDVVTVEDGVVSSVAIGTAIITVTTEEGGFTNSCTITVEGIDKYMSASYIGGMTFSGGGQSAYCDCTIRNNSNVNVYVKSVTISGRVYSINETVSAKSQLSHRCTTSQYNSTKYTVVYTVVYGGVEYTVVAN